ncbi:MAG: Transcriptional regulator of nonfermentable carbon utilization [Thelocarpon superellum]|nr:MAG: Transcriptional regulator of nonfermentable carbon utilization [Thelocarpon superellum]
MADKMEPDVDVDDDSDPSSASSSDDHADMGNLREDKDIEVPDQTVSNAAANATATTASHATASSTAKDPLRPRRKKARRACFACQRAHLTCGDERPCQRCIKRGLQDSCHDGMRKKAKYLHDAPNDALMPGIVPGPVTSLGEYRQTLPVSSTMSSPETPGRIASQAQFFSHQAVVAPGLGVHSPAGTQGQMAPPLPDYGGPPMASVSVPPGNGHPSLQGLADPLPSPVDAFGGALLDPADPALFNFDLASLNFGNHYGALEFGMLGHMSSGAADLSPGPPGFWSAGEATSTYVQSPGSATFAFGPDTVMEDWPSNAPSRQGSLGRMYRPGNGAGNGDLPSRRRTASLAHGYTIGTGPSSLTSPSNTSSPPEVGVAFDRGGPDARLFPSNFVGGGQDGLDQVGARSYDAALGTTHNASNPLELRGTMVEPGQASASIYDTVKSPYSYTQGFHRLTAFLQSQFSAQKRLRVAKSLGAVRPSFISCNKGLNQDDLLFMEQCFQRTLQEFESLIDRCGTPVIVCRRTGEVAAVGEAFSILTGWKKEVLLGREPNRNINPRAGSSGTGTSASRAGFTAPRIPEGSKTDGVDGSSAQPVLLAELLDPDSVVEFWEDFAKLAYIDPRGSAQGRCKLYKYKTRIEDVDDAGDERGADGRGHSDVTGARRSSVDRLESDDGMVECAYCWTVKRDVFDTPMMIVMNVSRDEAEVRYASLT